MMFKTDEDPGAIPLEMATVTAGMSRWMIVQAFGEPCLFGFATLHSSTGGLSWTLSTRVVQITTSADRARTASGRVYQLGQKITLQDLDEEGGVALRALLSADEPVNRQNDVAWLTAQKMARHLGVHAPPYRDLVAVNRFLENHLYVYLKLMRNRRDGF